VNEYQLASCPYIAVLTKLLVHILFAIICASFCVLVPLIVTVINLVAPSPSRTINLANVALTRVNAA